MYDFKKFKIKIRTKTACSFTSKKSLLEIHSIKDTRGISIFYDGVKIGRDVISDFYKQFDGIKVLPKQLIEQYQDYLTEGKFTLAEMLKVSIKQRRFFKLLSESLVVNEAVSYGEGRITNEKIVLLEYSHELGLLNEPVENNIQDEQFL
jgi:hypothetical protein